MGFYEWMLYCAASFALSRVDTFLLSKGSDHSFNHFRVPGEETEAQKVI